MKCIIALLWLGASIVSALPIDMSSNVGPLQPYKISEFTTVEDNTGVLGWLVSPEIRALSNTNSGTTVKVYQNNALVKAGNKGAAWVVEVNESIDPKSIKTAKQVQNVRFEQSAASDQPLLAASSQGVHGKSAMLSGTLTGKDGGQDGSATPNQGGGSIVAMTTQIGEQIGDRIGQPIGAYIGSQIGKAIGQPIGRAIGGAIGQGISSIVPGS